MITVYSKKSCKFCDATYRALDKYGVKYQVFNIEEDDSNFQKVVDLGYQVVPVVVTDDGESWSGFDLERIRQLAA